MLTGIEANYPNKDYVGVFSFVYKGATVKNVRVENSTFVGGQNVGAIAGMNAGRIENSVANSDVTANSHAAGGITGVNSGYINCSVNGGNVKTSGMYAGGISGVNTGSISDIYNKGSVSAQTYVGGIVGLNNGTNGNAVVERAFQLGQISGNVKGNVSGDNMNAAIKQCRHIQGSDIKNVSAFNNGGSVSASAARPAYEFKSKAAFSDWTGFDNNFMFVADVNHPILKAEYVKVSGIEFAAGSTIKLRPGEEIRLGERVVPSHASIQKIKLSVETGSEYCELSDGVVKINEDAKVGSYITVAGEAEGAVGIAQIEIIPIRVESVELNSEADRTTVAPGTQLQLFTQVNPINSTVKDIRYTSSNPFADVDVDGVLRVSQDAPVGLEFTVTASSYDNISISDEMTFTVIEAQVKSVEVTNSVFDFKVTGSVDLVGNAVTESITTDEVDFEIISEKTTAQGARIVGRKLYADLPGEICVVARYAGVNSKEVVFTANEEPVTGVEFLNGNSFPVNGALNIIAQALPDYATFRDVTLSIVEDNDVGATLEGNILTAKSTGMVTLKAEAGGKYATMTVYVEPASETIVEVAGISLDVDSYLLTRTLTLVPIVEPSNAQVAVYFEIVSDGGTGVELVDGKLQNAKRPGKIILSAYTSNFRTFVTVEAKKVAVESVYFTSANRFKITRSLKLDVATNPANPTYPYVNYQIISSTANGADVVDGILTAQSVGEIVLRAWVDGVPSGEFKVYAEKEPVTDVRFTSTSKSFKHTESLILEAMALPMQATYKNVEYSIDESGTTAGIDANINGNVLTAKAPGTVTVIMRCDGHDYPVVIAVEKEPVISVSELETKLWSKNKSEKQFRTSGVLELTAHVYPFNATYRGIEVSIFNDGNTGAKFLSSKDADIDRDGAAVMSKEILSGEWDSIYLAAKFEGTITVRIKSLDNPQIYIDQAVTVKEEFVSDIHFGMKRGDAINTAALATEQITSETVVGDKNGVDYYYFDKMYFLSNIYVNGSLSQTFSLSYDVFAYAADTSVDPTYGEEYVLYYYKNKADLDSGNVAKRIEVGSAEDNYLVKQGDKLIAKNKKAKIWLVAVSTHGDKDVSGVMHEVISQAVELTIYPTNISDLKSLRVNVETGVVSGGTAAISDMSGYEVIVESSKINFTKFISTIYTKLWLKLYKYNIDKYKVTLNVVFDRGTADEYKFNVPMTVAVDQDNEVEFQGIQAVPADQLSSIKGGDQYNAIVIFDLSSSARIFRQTIEFDKGVKFMYLYGDSSIQHKNLDFAFNNGDSPVEVTLHNINYEANQGKHAMRVNGSGRLTLNVKGDVTLRGGASRDGSDGWDGSSYIFDAAGGVHGHDANMNWNPFAERPDGQDGKNGKDGKTGRDGKDGENGGNGGFGIRLAIDDNVTPNFDQDSRLQLIGIDGGNGGRGGDGGLGGDGGKKGSGLVLGIPYNGKDGKRGNDGSRGVNGGPGYAGELNSWDY